jgi:tRNA pseudouridine55 synthase
LSTPSAETPAAGAAPSGILLLDKPLGCSSNAALQRVRRCAGGAKAGHAGSLDPLASGMLAICLGEATRLAGEIEAGRKAYRFVLQLGERTATGDAEGEVIERTPIPPLARIDVEQVLARFTGAQQQMPPMYSALKRDGVPLYRLARRGISVERAARALVIDELELLDSGAFDASGALRAAQLELQVRCSKGTYVRVLGEDIAAALGSCGHLVALRRLYLEPFASEPMVELATLEGLECAAWPLLPPERALLQLPRVQLDERALRSLAHGRAVPTATLSSQPLEGPRFRLYEPHGRFCGVGERDAHGELKARWLMRAFRPA